MFIKIINLFGKFILLLLSVLIIGQLYFYSDSNALAEQEKGELIITEVKTSVFLDTDNTYEIGSMVKIEVRGNFKGFDIKEGTVRINSVSQRYDSDLKNLTLSEVDSYFFCYWDSWGLKKADDYRVTVNITDETGQAATDSKRIIFLTSEPILRNLLIRDIDLYFPDRGLSPQIVRSYMISSGYNGVLGRKWTHSYNMHLQEWPDGTVKIFEPFGGASWYVRNADGNYRSRPNDYSILSKNPNGIFQRRHKNGIIERFDSKGKLLSISDPNNNQLTFEYDKNGLLVRITSPSGQSIRLTYSSSNRISSIIDSAKKKIIYNYNKAEDLVSVTNQAGFKTKYAYDLKHYLITVTDPKGCYTAFIYDMEGRVISQMNNRENNIIDFNYSATEPKISITNALGEKIVLNYNDSGDIVAVMDPLGNITRYSYDYAKNLVNIINANGNSIELTYDERGNMAAVKYPSGNVTTFAYDNEYNKVIALTDALKRITSFSCDFHGNLIELIFPNGSSEKYEYDKFGNLIKKTDRKDQAITYKYDTKSRLINKTYPDLSNISYTYDSIGNLTSITNKNGTIRYKYDVLNRITKITYPGKKTTHYKYDVVGNRTRTVTPDGGVLSYVYDEVNRFIQIRRGKNEVIVRYEYDKAGRRIKRELGNGVYTTYTYDEVGRLVELVNKKSSGEIISSFSYTYDKVGNRLTMTTKEGTHVYNYDNDYQLVKVIYPDGKKAEYDYDALGNRASVVVNRKKTKYVTNNLNQYESIEGVNYKYDANGNLIWDGRNRYEYNYEDYLVRIKTPNETINYAYNPLGRRISKTKQGRVICYLRANDQVIMETDEKGKKLASYFYGYGIDEILLMQREGKDYYFLQDGLGSVVNLIDTSGNIIEKYDYDVYGQPYNSSSVGNPYMFTGREYDVETNLYYYRSRYYNLDLGRFLNEDPIGFAGGINLYAYVKNNPTNFVDPTGTFGPWWTPGPGPPGDPLDEWAPRGDWEEPWPAPRTPPPGWGDKPWPPNFDEPSMPGPQPRVGPSSSTSSVASGDPTFVQRCKSAVRGRKVDNVTRKYNKELIAKLTLPDEYYLVRGNVPIFGLAYGKNFKEYRVEYAEGKDPKEWIPIKQSTIPQAKDVTPADLDDSADITIHGNLATWDTGLKSYVYLPDYPPDHPVDLNGVYTLRLLVIGENGERAEDRVTVEVGEAIPNAWGGIVRSKEKRVALNIPEQSLMESFRVISIKPIVGLNIKLPKDRKLISSIYEFREPGDLFTKDVTLEIKYSKENLGKVKPDRLGIYAYDSKKRKWLYLSSYRIKKEDKIKTTIRKLFPYYAILTSNLEGEGSTSEEYLTSFSSESKAVESTSSDGLYIIRDTFEDSLVEWSNRDEDVGAQLSRDNISNYDGTYCLKITNTNYGGNFAANINRTPFHIKEYPMVQFDYKIPSDVKINFLAKVNDRWYEIGFTDDYNEYKYKRVNIANIGRIEGIIADDSWHTARFNLYEMLRTKTKNHIVEEMIMADWDLEGFMKLKFGNNSKGATYFIDNFIIRKQLPVGLSIDEDILLVDNFNQKKESNALGATSEVFVDSIGGRVQLSFVTDNNTSKKEGHALKISYDVSKADSFAGYLTRLESLDLRNYNTLSFIVKSSKVGEILQVGLKDGSENESKVFVSDYLQQGISTTWKKVEIPLVAFSNIKDWASIGNLSFSFGNISEGSKGEVFLDDIQFEKDLRSFMVNNFEKEGERNLLGGRSWTFLNGACAINASYKKSSSNGVYCLSYGGSIGELFIYAGWTTQLQGIDCSGCNTLSFSIKGAAGGEKPNIYLDDGTYRWGVEVNEYVPVTSSWEKVSIPLKDFADYGVDLTHIEELQFVFEWEEMSGTIYIDDIKFEG